MLNPLWKVTSGATYLYNEIEKRKRKRIKANTGSK
jgi:hypothetical protein